MQWQYPEMKITYCREKAIFRQRLPPSLSEMLPMQASVKSWTACRGHQRECESQEDCFLKQWIHCQFQLQAASYDEKPYCNHCYLQYFGPRVCLPPFPSPSHPSFP
ncbi:uncharacterized protein [Narcine bancroftii]|uniref:uncharacterized protein isoform X2 n=1 Tax=Narcine bancroftii TaxID=1343680 RepID=UPI0038319DBE